MADPGEDGFGEWGRMDFRFVVRKAGYPLALRGAWLTVWCAVGLERRGGLIRWETVVGLVGKRLADTLVERGDLDREGDRDVRMHGWEVHQSPLERTRLQAAERQRRRREKLRQQGEDGEVLSRDATVTDRDERVTLSISLSSSSTGTGNGVVAESRDESPPAPAREGDDVWSVVLAVEEMTSRPWTYGNGSPVMETLRGDVRDHGAERVLGTYRTFLGNGPVDAAQLVFGGHKALFPIPSGKGAAEVVRASEAERAWQSRVERSRDRTREMREAMGYGDS